VGNDEPLDNDKDVLVCGVFEIVTIYSDISRLLEILTVVGWRGKCIA
jgi:hypothetical protein